jgi:methionyl-tRNA formyltransferase
LDEKLTIACAEGAIRLTKVQRPGRPPVAGPDFLRGFTIRVGDRLSG